MVDLKYNFECVWLIELSDNKLFDNNLASEYVKNMSPFIVTPIEKVNCFFFHMIIIMTSDKRDVDCKFNKLKSVFRRLSCY